MASAIKENMKSIFYKVQFKKTNHPQYMKELTKLYEKTDLDIFWEHFVWCLKVPLSNSQQQPNIVNTLEFCVEFCMSFFPSLDNESTESVSPFLSKLFQFLLSSHNAKDKGVRFRICHFLNMLLNSLGDNAFIDDNLCDQITVSMMERLLDKSPKVRAQAVFALYRLQDPSDEQCPVIEMYLFHVSRDPSSKVRKAILATMGKNQKTLQAAFMRTRDIDDSVRKKAYEFISKVTVRSLTIKQRERLLKDGLKDRSENVRTCVNNVLLPAWLRCFKGEYMSFIHALDAGVGTESGTLALQVLFRNADLNTLLEQVPIDKNTKLIPLTSLTNENVLYWKCIIQHLHHLSSTEELELMITELSEFCKYIRSFVAFISSQSHEIWETESHKFILLQLFEISTMYDLSDEVGRKNLNEVIIDTLMSDYCSTKIIECLVSHLTKVVPDPSNLLNAVANIISEIRLPLKENVVSQQITADQQHENNMQETKLKVEVMELEEELYQAIKEQNFLQADSLKEKINTLKEEINRLCNTPETVTTEENLREKNDTVTMVKCLDILYVAMQSIRVLTPTLKSLMCLVLNSLDHPHDSVQVLALKTLCVYCILDKELAKKLIKIFFYQFSLEQENQDMWVVSLKAIFDLLLVYGLEYFDIVPSLENNSVHNKSEKIRSLYTHEDSIHEDISINKRTEIEEGPCNFIKILKGLLISANQDLRTIAAEGFCKLLLNQRINSSSLLLHLIIMCFNPVNVDDIYLCQCLSAFFDCFIGCVPDAQEMLESAYLPTLQVLCNAPDFSPLQEINAYHVSRFILGLTRRGCQKSSGQTFYTHNNLAFAILAEILNPESKIDQEILIRSLTDLCIQLQDDNLSKQNLQKAIKNVTKMVVNYDKRLLKYIQQFKQKLEMPSEDDSSDTEL
ncbi:PREDICTED: condensin complex subunit 3-like [Cyphomyrmex costatus]|uniref:Condensin complex subunit 3 n=1 Tax=Cyphomyrmex costatus TaxID=456900 RepID=A0A195C689_9HYME|nr:PREDICTED: condensin complex subunit 3-like [Cyphomyrmex costatus]KYM96379.1 Condensin complex subunit 3 [Cyphomyrmex costatus]